MLILIHIDSHNGTIQIDYGYLDRTVSKVEEEIKSSQDEKEIVAAGAMFYTRQLYYNVMITVYRNLEAFNWDVVYLRHSTPASPELLEQALKTIKMKETVTTSKTISLLQNQPVEDLLLVTRNMKLENQERNEYCLITVDIKNVWTIPFDVDFTIDNSGEGEITDDLESHVTIQPGSTTR